MRTGTAKKRSPPCERVGNGVIIYLQRCDATKSGNDLTFSNVRPGIRRGRTEDDDAPQTRGTLSSLLGAQKSHVDLSKRRDSCGQKAPSSHLRFMGRGRCAER